MKKFLLILTSFLLLSIIDLTSQLLPPCVDCDPNGFVYTYRDYTLNGMCPGCQVRVYFWKNDDCKEIFIDHFTNGNEACSSCPLSSIFYDIVTELLVNGPYTPELGGEPVITRIMSYACYRYYVSPTNGWYCMSCDNSICCKAKYSVVHDLLGIHVWILGYPELIPPNSVCPENCEIVCNIGYYPHYPYPRNPNINDNSEDNLIPNSEVFKTFDGINYYLKLNLPSEGLLKINYYNYTGLKLFAYEKQINTAGIFQDKFDLSFLKGFNFYIITFNSNIINSGKLFLNN